VVADCAAALGWLKALPTSNGKVGIIGTCSGGRHALLTASRVAGFDAVADLWDGGVIASSEELSPARPVAVIDYPDVPARGGDGRLGQGVHLLQPPPV
jgi:carboxymethylenebutenolidase